MFFQAISLTFSRPFSIRRLLKQLEMVGVNSLPVVILTAIFTGIILAVQGTYQIAKFGASTYVGGIMGITMLRELGPVLTALVVSGRVGAGISAELGTMNVTEQIDALRSLAANPVKYLVVPRMWAGVIMLPALTSSGGCSGRLRRLGGQRNHPGHPNPGLLPPFLLHGWLR